MLAPAAQLIRVDWSTDLVPPNLNQIFQSPVMPEKTAAGDGPPPQEGTAHLRSRLRLSLQAKLLLCQR